MDDIVFEICSDLPREGPGNTESTRRAFSLLAEVPDNPTVLDIGCGSGKQTLELARLTGGRIIALDVHYPYLSRLRKKAAREGLSDRVTAVQGDMHRLCFRQNMFDLVWAEGSIFVVGFENGLKTWRSLLKERGGVALTELTWLEKNPPSEVSGFFREHYPVMQTIDANRDAIRRSGYEEIGHFVVPESAWWVDYYEPLERRLAMLRGKYQNNHEVMAVLNTTQEEIDLYREYSRYYGYVFYVMKFT